MRDRGNSKGRGEPGIRAFPAALAVLLLIVPMAHAHDVGAMCVTITPSVTGCTVRVIADPEHLTIARLGPIDPGQSPGVWPDEFARRFESGARLFQGSQVLHLEQAAPARLANIDGLGNPTSGPARIDVSFDARMGPDESAELRWQSELPVGQYLLRWSVADGEDTRNQWLEPGEISSGFSAPTLSRGPLPDQDLGSTFVQYLRLGISHIVPGGLDHILFVLGLYLLNPRARPVLAQVTLFTLAHSISLALAATGTVRVPSSIVEPAIALSIVFVGIENLLVGEATARRLAVVFAFGLLHGLGFAGALAEVGLPARGFVTALFAFNIGVEIGQLLVIAAATLCIGMVFARKPWFRARVAIPLSLLIAAAGGLWALQRISI